jgi:hypothetical protein
MRILRGARKRSKMVKAMISRFAPHSIIYGGSLRPKLTIKSVERVV